MGAKISSRGAESRGRERIEWQMRLLGSPSWFLGFVGPEEPPTFHILPAEQPPKGGYVGGTHGEVLRKRRAPANAHTTNRLARVFRFFMTRILASVKWRPITSCIG